MRVQLPPGTTCIEDDCNKSRYKRGWCTTHYERARRHGDPRVVIRRQFSTVEAAWDYYMPNDPPVPGVVWPWAGPRHQLFGYGVIYFNNQSVLAHRYSYEKFIGPIPDGLMIRHKNDIPIDVNPHNLLVGTHADNMHDMADRGRRNNSWKLSSDAVAAIRAARASGEKLHVIAARFGISESYVGYLARGARR